MAQVVLDAANLKKAMRHLAKVDPDFARILKEVGHPELREVPTGFSGLMRSIVGQQVSVHAARSIWPGSGGGAEHGAGRFPGALRRRAARRGPVGRRCAMAAASPPTSSGRIDFNALHELDDAAASPLCQPGIGP
jgi:DNA-3-methyladenine glycosylase II